MVPVLARVGVVRVRVPVLARVGVVRVLARSWAVVGVVRVQVQVQVQVQVRVLARVGVVRAQVPVLARVGVVRVQVRVRVPVLARVGVVRARVGVVRSPRAVQEGRPARGAGEPAVHRPTVQAQVPRRSQWRVGAHYPLMGPPWEPPRRRSPAALAAVYRPGPVRFPNRRRQASRRRPSRPRSRTGGSFARLPPRWRFALLRRCSQVERLYRRDPGSYRRPLWLRGRRPSRAR